MKWCFAIHCKLLVRRKVELPISVSRLDTEGIDENQMHDIEMFPFAHANVPLFPPQGLYIFLVYAVYNSEVRGNSVHFQCCCRLLPRQNILMFVRYVRLPVFWTNQWV